MNALKLLSDLDYNHKIAKYKDIPPYAIPRVTYSDRTANALAKAILTFLKLKGHMAWRQSSEGRYRPGKQYTDVLGHVRQMKGQWLLGQNNGASDCAAIIRGQFTALEIKIGKDVQSEIQKQYQKQVEGSGGKYIIVRTFEAFFNWYNQQ